MLDKMKSEFKAGINEGRALSRRDKRIRYSVYAISIIIFISLCFLIYPSTASLDNIVSRYGMNDIYRSSSSYPGAHTAYYANIHIALFPGVNETFIRESIKGVNPFYRFDFIDYHSAKYHTNKDGLIYSDDRNTVVISMNDNPCTKCMCNTTHGTALYGVQIWIKNGEIVTPEYMRYLIPHELDHLYGLPCIHPSDMDINSYWQSENVTSRYTEQTREYGTVVISRFSGTTSESYTIYI